MRYLNSCKIYSSVMTAALAFILSSCMVEDHGVATDAPATLAAPVPPTPNEIKVTVSGISSGGYMAVQTHLALSARIDGVAVLAGGPYHCAEGNIAYALGRCINGNDLDVASLVGSARDAAAAGQIGPLDELHDARVWIFQGQQDQVVSADVAAATRDFYRAFVPQNQIVLVDNIPAAHGWPTLDQGEECGVMSSEFFNACEYDAAGALLQHLYGRLNPPVAMQAAALKTFDQKSLVAEGGSFAAEGLAYVPQTCSEADNDCRLHIAFHGCRQGREFIGDKFAMLTGLNEWAESNGIVVLYPQVNSSPLNPLGCWDWWGYSGQDYDRKSGKQVSSIMALIEAWTR